MAIYLDSTDVDEARQALGWGFVIGVTTNPALMARAGRPPAEVIADLCHLGPIEVFYQLTSRTLEEMEAEARKFHALGPEQVILKVPCDLMGLRLVARLWDHIPCALTAVFSPAQVYLAVEAGARYVIPYVNRATRLCGDGVALVAEMAEMLTDADTKLLAASLKSPAEVVATLMAGAHHVTMPLAVIRDMAAHPLSDQAIAEFAQATRP